MLARLESSLEHERRFVADASHELRTPLALLRAELEVALRRTRTPAELEATLRSAAEETERLSRLAEDLLLIARADSGALPVAASRIAAGDVLATVAGRFALRAERMERAIRVEDDRRDARRRPAAPRAGARQPRRQRPVARRGHGGALGEARGRARRAARRGRRRRVPGQVPPAARSTASAARDEARSRGGSGLGLVDRRPDRRCARRQRRRGEPAGGGADVWIVAYRLRAGLLRGRRFSRDFHPGGCSTRQVQPPRLAPRRSPDPDARRRRSAPPPPDRSRPGRRRSVDAVAFGELAAAAVHGRSGAAKASVTTRPGRGRPRDALSRRLRRSCSAGSAAQAAAAAAQAPVQSQAPPVVVSGGT